MSENQESTTRQRGSESPTGPAPQTFSIIARVYAGDFEGSLGLPELIVRTSCGRRSLLRLDADSVSVGRSAANTLSFADDEALSRRHLSLEKQGPHWFVSDLASKNGTFINGAPVAGRRRLEPGDTIVAGGVVMAFQCPGRDRSVAFDPSPSFEPTQAQSTSLNAILTAGCVPDRSVSEGGANRRVDALWAFVRAGQELADRRPLPELFHVTLDLSLEATNAGRGVLMTLDEGDRLVVQASRGGELHIPSSVRDQVLKDRSSILVLEAPAATDPRRADHAGLHSFIAVPLQTEDRVIGFIYIDSRQHSPQFTRDDLNLLTVIASVASIGIERERWELQRRMLIAENIERLGRLAAALSHELNTPLGTLKSTIDSLLRTAAYRGSAPPEEQTQLEAIQGELGKSLNAALERMEQVMGRIQRFTNLDRAEVHHIDLNELLADVVALAEEASVEIRLLRGDLPALRGHRQALSSSFASLLRFAIEATRQAEMTSRVEVLTTCSETAVEARILSHGQVLTAEEAGRLFEPTFRVAEGRISAGNWSLFTARQVIQELGGEIRVEAEPARGTTFVVRFSRQSVAFTSIPARTAASGRAATREGESQ